MTTASPSLVTIDIEGMVCRHCVTRVTDALSTLPGIEVKNVAIGNAQVIAPDDAAANSVLESIRAAGYTARRSSSPAAKNGGCCCSARAIGTAPSGNGSCCA